MILLLIMSIFEHTDYRKFLRSHIENLPKKGRGEINRLALFMGVHPSLLSQVLSDAKNLTLEQAQLACEYLGLTSQETEHLLCSVQYQRAGTAKLRTYFKEKLTLSKQASVELSERVRQDRQLSEEEVSVFYSHWLYAAIWLQSSLPKGTTLETACERFHISRERASEILHFLAETRLCISLNGHYQMGPQSIHLARGSVHLGKHHTNWRLRAIENSDKISQEELMYTAPISISKSDFKKIRTRVTEFIKEVTDTAIQSEADEIACFNLDLFWIRK